jgi:hypothetical protein
LIFNWYGRAGADQLGWWAEKEGGYSTTVKDSAYLAQAQHQLEQALLGHLASKYTHPTEEPELQIDLVPYPKVTLDAEDTLSRNFGGLFV